MPHLLPAPPVIPAHSLLSTIKHYLGYLKLLFPIPAGVNGGFIFWIYVIMMLFCASWIVSLKGYITQYSQRQELLKYYKNIGGYMTPDERLQQFLSDMRTLVMILGGLTFFFFTLLHILNLF